jgi:hypothetical protein
LSGKCKNKQEKLHPALASLTTAALLAEIKKVASATFFV